MKFSKTFQLILFNLIITSIITSCTYYLGPNKWAKKFDQEIGLKKSSKTNSLSQVKIDNNISMFSKQLENYSKQNHVIWSDKYKDTILNPRVVFVKLLLNKEIFQVNADILKYKAWGTTGTSGLLNPKGDYDFNEILWTNIVWYFNDEPEVLFPLVAQHIIDELIIDNGAEPELKAPNTLGLVRETENHILMKEISRYLKNQWLFEHGHTANKYNNKLNGMDAFFIHHLTEMKNTGFYEFNANPYISYTFEALHVIYNFADNKEIQLLSKQIMDNENLQYAFGSYQLKKYGPFRRRLSRESIKDLDGDRHGVLIRIELSKFYNDYNKKYKINCCFDRTIISLSSKYILPKTIVEVIENKKESYYTKIGHGIKSTPEIYYGTEEFLLSAGGLRFGKRSQIVPRPITLFLNDDSKIIDDCFHIKGKGNLNKWNNTGVYKNFAVGNHNVFVPNSYTSIESFNNWDIYKPYSNKDIFICVYNQKDFGLIYVSNNENYKVILNKNTDAKIIQNSFNFNNNENITYNVNKRKRWVIESINGVDQERRFGKWKRFDVKYF